MALPKIYNPNPVAIPAQDAASYPDSYMIGLNLSPIMNGKQSLKTTFRPFNQTTGQIYQGWDKDFSFTVQDIFAEAARSTLFAQVMGGLLTLASLEVQEQDLLKKIAALPAGDPTLAALQAQLAAVRQAMGVSA